MADRRRTNNPPELSKPASTDTATMEEYIRRTLQTNHLLDVPLRYVIFVEGETDVSYITTAAKLVAESTGVDLLWADQDSEIVVAAPARAYPAAS